MLLSILDCRNELLKHTSKFINEGKYVIMSNGGANIQADIDSGGRYRYDVLPKNGIMFRPLENSTMVIRDKRYDNTLFFMDNVVLSPLDNLCVDIGGGVQDLTPGAMLDTNKSYFINMQYSDKDGVINSKTNETLRRLDISPILPTAWINGANMNGERYEYNSAGRADNCIVLGGIDNNNTNLNTTEVYNGSIWSNSTNMNSTRRGHSAAGITNDCMVMGGYSNIANITAAAVMTDTIEIYNGTIWSNSTNMNRTRYGHTSVGTTNNCMVIGAYPDSNTTEKYNGIIWSNSTNMNNARFYHNSVGIVNDCMVTGGHNGTTYLNTTEVYNGSIWSNSTNMNSIRYTHSAVGITNNSMVMGGGSGNGAYYNTTEIYNNISWSNGISMNSVRYALSSLGMANNCMATGGSTGSTKLSSTEKFQSKQYNFDNYDLSKSHDNTPLLSIYTNKPLEFYK